MARKPSEGCSDLQNIEVAWKELREVYCGDSKNLEYTDLPAEPAVVQTFVK